jgi:uncharacterized protein
VKHLNFAIIAGTAFALLAAAPLSAQLSMGVGSDFLDAVKKSDGDKAINLLNSHPDGLVNAKDTDGNTALLIVIARRDADWTGYLLNHEADPNLAGKGGETPLIAAARAGFDDAVPWLIGLGAKVDATNRAGETALIVAVQQRNAPIVQLLLNAGANPDKTDNTQGYSARQYAQRDPRARDILALIESKSKPAKSDEPAKLDDFKLK